jgi:hypothetical protein
MRGLFLSFSHPSPIMLVMLVGLLVLSPRFLWAQRTLPLEKIPIHLLDTPAPFARVSEVQIPLHLTDRKLPQIFERNQGQTDSRMKFLPHYPGDYRLPTTTTTAALDPATRTAERWSKLWDKEKYLVGNAPSKWRTFSFALTNSEIPRETTCCVGDLEHYGRRIPWAGSIILRILQQAKAHPHVTRVLTVLKPQL